MRKLLLFAFLCLPILYTGCSSDNEKCQDAVCTCDFQSIRIELKYEDGTPVILDSYEVIEVATGKTHDVWEDIDLSEWGRYAISTDFDRQAFFDRKVKLQFIGKIGGKVIVTKNHIVSADCCHIYLVEGDRVVTIKNM